MISLAKTHFELEVEFNFHERLKKFPLVCVVKKKHCFLISAPVHLSRRHAGGKVGTKLD